MDIRRAVAADAPALTALALRAKQYWGYSPAQMEAWREDLRISADMLLGMPGYVLEAGQQIVGFYLLRIDAATVAPACELDHLWLAPEHMRQGHGRALLAHASDTARQLGCNQLTIDADPYALSFYLACGARRVGQVAAPIEGQPGRMRPQLLLGLT
ncbi:MAG: GNAT family N-acetyltransferase [Pseudomonadota bacterium]